MLGIGEGVLAGDVELVIANVVEEHVNAAEIVGGEIDLLTVESLAHFVAPEKLGSLQKQRAGATGGVIDLVDLGLVADGDAGEKLGDFLRREKLATALAGVGGIHAHEVFVGVAEGIDSVVLVGADVAEVHGGDAIEKLAEFFVALDNAASKLVAIDIDVVKESGKITFTRSALGGVLDVLEDLLEDHVEVIGVLGGVDMNIAEELRRQDEEAARGNNVCAGRLGVGIGELGVIEIVGRSGFDL